jgi:hypothetical protein
MIKNNNIKCISPSGKEFLTHFHWMQSIIQVANGNWEEVKTKLIGIFDGMEKAEIVARTFKSKKLEESELEEIKAKLNNNEVVEVHNWKFKTI